MMANSETYFAAGDAFFRQGQMREALAEYSAAIELSPADSAAYFERGRTFRILGEYKRAIADFNRVIALDPEDSGAYFYRGLAYARLGNTTRPQQTTTTPMLGEQVLMVTFSSRLHLMNQRIIGEK